MSAASYIVSEVSYILAMNGPQADKYSMLYHATTILLHRPFRTNPSCRNICTQATAEMEHLLCLLDGTYGLTRVTYLMAYCTYTAATVAMLDLHDGIHSSQMRLNTYLRALYSVRSSCPGIQRSIDIIIKALAHSRPTKAASPGAVVAPQQPEEPAPLPMFPFDEMYDFNVQGMQEQGDLPFGSLDPFATDWSFMANDIFSQTYA